MPASMNVGTFGRLLTRFAEVMASARTLPSRMWGTLGPSDCNRADAAAAADAIVDHQLLAEPTAQLLSHEARHAVDRRSRRKRHDEADRLARPVGVLRPRWRRE